MLVASLIPDQNMFLYRLGGWVHLATVYEDQNWKIIMSKNIIFDEKTTYKEKSSTTRDFADANPHEFKFVTLNEFLKI